MSAPFRVTDPEVVDDMVDLWHEGAGQDMTLAQFLGWSEVEYSLWVEHGEMPS